MIIEILLILDMIGLGMLLGGGVYESVIINPNYSVDIPQSINLLRSFMKVKTPANFFRVLSPFTMIILLVTVILYWDIIPARWWFAASFLILILADTITFSFHYPRNKVLFTDPLSSDIDLLKRSASQWQTGNFARILLMVLAVVSLMLGIFSLFKL